MGLGFTALGLLPLPEATALGYAAPLLTVILAAMFLGEKVRIFRLSAVVGRPRRRGHRAVAADLTVRDVGRRLAGARPIGAMAALARRGLRRARAGLRAQARADRAARAAIVFYFSVTASVLSLATLPFGWVVPSAGGGGAADRAPACSAGSGRSC